MVEPEDGMKKPEWSETLANSERAVATKLPSPPSTSDPFGDAEDTTSARLLSGLEEGERGVPRANLGLPG